MSELKTSQAGIKLSNEVTSYIYQQLTDLQDFMPEDASTSVKVSKSKDGCHKVSIHVKAEGGSLKGKGSHKDIYKAIADAKALLVKEFERIQGLVESSAERENHVNSIVKGGWIH